MHGFQPISGGPRKRSDVDVANGAHVGLPAIPHLSDNKVLLLVDRRGVVDYLLLDFHLILMGEPPGNPKIIMEIQASKSKRSVVINVNGVRGSPERSERFLGRMRRSPKKELHVGLVEVDMPKQTARVPTLKFEMGLAI